MWTNCTYTQFCSKIDFASYVPFKCLHLNPLKPAVSVDTGRNFVSKLAKKININQIFFNKQAFKACCIALCFDHI